jgi:hypothetical protein
LTIASIASRSSSRQRRISATPGLYGRPAATIDERLSSEDHVAVPDLPLTGGCNCGAVRYEVTAPLEAASYCHCRRCQRRSGAAASPNAHPDPDSFRIVSGEDRLRVWKPDDGGEKWFCGDCGSSVFARNPRHAHPIGIRMGTFDGDPGIRPSVRQFVRYAAPWEPLPDDGLPRHQESRHSTTEG